MLKVNIKINNEPSILDLSAVRLRPKGKIPKKHEKCLYEVRADDVYIGQVYHPYGDALSLTRKLLEFYELYEEAMKLKKGETL